ncbi:SpoIIE family protein phosphatase [Laribacter hongkongensis]|uniref:SpoIIE family protein phosphatase n=1 Tax=Laribacter hongkongensis TaxID=168471 RepID=UPI001EFC9C8D|nr:SpoIIE family protein phosphatase [Laribacter hongkongensis]MCG9125623.1 SpoIIE family protein phosphatase [Laribacter hongkongensis]
MSAILRLGLRSKAATFMGLLAVMLLLAAVATSWIFIDLTRERYGAEVVRNHALLSKEQFMLPVARELALSQKLADSDATRNFLRDESRPDYRKAFFAEAESFRRLFGEHSLFAGVIASRHFYFNDNTLAFSSAPRGTMQRDVPADAWFFASTAKRTPYNFNINTNQQVGVTNVWVNVLVTDTDGTPLGFVGTGFELTHFLQRFARHDTSGLSSMLLAGNGAIQAHPDPARIEHQMVTDKVPTQTLFRLLSGPDDQPRVQAAMQRLRTSQSTVETLNVTLEGQQQLMAITWLPALDWFAVSAVEAHAGALLDSSLLLGALSVLAGLLVLAMILMYFGTHLLVFKPLLALSQGVRSMESGRYDINLHLTRQDEIGELATAFNRMASRVQRHTAELEATVSARTRELTDMLTRQQDNIHCARMIQHAMLPQTALTETCQGQLLVLWRPKDIVSGDLYLFHRDADGWLAGLVDCAGHGVTGALMTVLAHGAFQTAIDRVGSHDPAAILNVMNEIVRAPFAEQLASRQRVPTSMEAALVRIDPGHATLTYAGARIALYCVDRDGTVTVCKGGRRALGEKRQETYQSQTLPAQGLDCYLTSDGLLDQSGGPQEFGFGASRFAGLLGTLHTLPWADRLETLTSALTDWQGQEPQLDDICVIGFTAMPDPRKPAGDLACSSSTTPA